MKNQYFSLIFWTIFLTQYFLLCFQKLEGPPKGILHFFGSSVLEHALKVINYCPKDRKRHSIHSSAGCLIAFPADKILATTPQIVSFSLMDCTDCPLLLMYLDICRNVGANSLFLQLFQEVAQGLHDTQPIRSGRSVSGIPHDLTAFWIQANSDRGLPVLAIFQWHLPLAIPLQCPTSIRLSFQAVSIHPRFRTISILQSSAIYHTKTSLHFPFTKGRFLIQHFGIHIKWLFMNLFIILSQIYIIFNLDFKIYFQIH